MNHETITTQIQNVPAMAPELQQEAIDLRVQTQTASQELNRKIYTAGDRHHADFLSGNITVGPSVVMSINDDISIGISRHKVRSSARAAKKHYKKHESEYQMQAYEEATADGVEINNWLGEKAPDTKQSRATRIGNAALAAADGGLMIAAVAPVINHGLAREIIPAYAAYRFGKGAAVRAKVAITGEGDPDMTLATSYPNPLGWHGTKDKLKEQRKRQEELKKRLER